MIPVSRPDLNEEDAQAVAGAVIATYVAGGPEIAGFESAVAARCSRRHGAAVTNGTAALDLAVRALDLPPGSRVLIPAFTIVSSLHAVAANGHVPVIADVDERTWNVEAETVRRIVRSGIEAAIVVETYASAPPMAEIAHLLNEHGVPMIEDAAEGFGGREDGRVFGSFGSLTVLSFYANKLITTGEGGMILTDEPVYLERLRALRNLYFDSERRFIHKERTGNYRLSNLQAALGLSQLKRADAFHAHRRSLYESYLELLGELEPFVQTQLVPSGVESSYWVFPVLLRRSSGLDATEMIKRLEGRGVEARHFFYPLDRQPWLEEQGAPSCEVSYQLWRQGLYLPLGNGISAEEVKTTAAAFREILLESK